MSKSFFVGRNPMNDLCLGDNSVSQRHAEISQEGESIVVRDLGSTNGTFVNGEKISSTVLKTGDTVSFGIVSFQWLDNTLISSNRVDGPLIGSNNSIGPLFQSELKAEQELGQRTSGTFRISRYAIGTLLIIVLLVGVVIFVTRDEQISVDELARSTVYIEVTDQDRSLCWTGSGVIVQDGTKVLTNAHVATPAASDPQECTNISVGITESVEKKPTLFIDAKIVKIDENLDLALLELLDTEPNTYNALKFKEGDSQLDTRIRVIGYPGIGGATLTLTNGVIAGIDDESSAQFYKVSAKISPGNSGGPVVNDQGLLIGIATAGYRAEVECEDGGVKCSVTDESIGLVRPIRYAKSLLGD
jgi:V8-like Glu-specific endopeptidase